MVGDNSPKTLEAMREKGMKPFVKGSARTRAIAIKGGRGNKNNPKSSLGQKRRYLREKGFTDKTRERLFELLKNKEFSELDMVNYLENIRKDPNLDTDTQLKVLAAIKDVHKILHGTRENDSKHAVLHLHLTKEEKEKEILRLLKD